MKTNFHSKHFSVWCVLNTRNNNLCLSAISVLFISFVSEITYDFTECDICTVHKQYINIKTN
jgi:hypothetical protein